MGKNLNEIFVYYFNVLTIYRNLVLIILVNPDNNPVK